MPKGALQHRRYSILTAFYTGLEKEEKEKVLRDIPRDIIMGRKKQGGPKKQGGYTSLAIGIAILIAVVAAWGVMNGFELSLTTSMPSKVKTKSAKASVTKGDTSTPVVPSTSDAKPKKAIKKDKKKENKKENRDEVYNMYSIGQPTQLLCGHR